MLVSKTARRWALSISLLAAVAAANAADGWRSNAIYTSGNTVSYQGKTYQAKWWTRGNMPTQNMGSGKPWKLISQAGSTGGISTGNNSSSTSASPATDTADSATASTDGGADGWRQTSIYTKGDKVSYQGKTYQAKWWTRANAPKNNVGVGKPWKVLATTTGNSNSNTGSTQNANVSAPIQPVLSQSLLLVSDSNDSLCISVPSAGITGTTLLEMKPCSGHAHQQWKTDSKKRTRPAINTEYCLEAEQKQQGRVSLARCKTDGSGWTLSNNEIRKGAWSLELASGRELISGTYRGNSNQRWLGLTDIPAGQSEVGHTLESKSKPGYCLTMGLQQGNSTLGVNFSRCEGGINQQWVVDESRVRTAADTAFCLDANTAYRAKVTISSCDAVAAPWSYDNAEIRSGNWAIDLAAGTDIMVWRYHGGNNQKWAFNIEDQSGVEAPQQPGSNNGTGSSVNDAEWTFLQVPANGPYGTRSFKVKAAQNWVNTGVYLRRGQTARISASGQWAVKASSLHGPQGSGTVKERGCTVGALAARTGLYYKSALHCVGSGKVVTAANDGILFVGAAISTDLGETYETRKNARGELQVTVTSAADTVPVIGAAQVASYNYNAVRSGWVELLGEHILVTLPVATASRDRGKLQAMLQRLDAIYLQHKILRGKLPYHGQPIRFYPDTKDAPGWMLAGNPVRMDPALVDVNGSSRITLAAEAGNNDWGFAHELGHDFNFAGGPWYYTTFGGLETWPNIFSVHALEKLGLPARTLDCSNKFSNYQSSGSYEGNFKKDPWLSLCFLMEFKDRYGWEFYQKFYQEFNRNPGSGWRFLRERFSKAANDDVNDIFNRWKLPQ